MKFLERKIKTYTKLGTPARTRVTASQGRGVWGGEELRGAVTCPPACTLTTAVRREHVQRAARLKPASIFTGAVVYATTIDRLSVGFGDRAVWPRLDRHGYIDMGIDSATAQPDCCFLQPAPVAQRRLFPCHSGTEAIYPASHSGQAMCLQSCCVRQLFCIWCIWPVYLSVWWVRIAIV